MAYYRERWQPTIDPLLSGVEAVAAGYRTVDYVFNAFAESIRRRPPAGYERGAPAAGPYGGGAAGGRGAAGAWGVAAAAPQQGNRVNPNPPNTGPGEGMRIGTGGNQYGQGQGQPAPAPLTSGGGLIHLVAEFLDVLGDAVRELAEGFGEEIFGDDVPTLRPRGFPGQIVELDFRFTNTGSSVLKGLGFEKTKLLGERGGVIEAERISFDLKPDTQLAPGASVVVGLKIDLQSPPSLSLPAGLYRGVIAAKSTPETASTTSDADAVAKLVGVNAWSLIELEIPALDANQAITTVDGGGGS